MKRLRPRGVPKDLKEALDEEQLNAVLNSKGRSIVISGPGSGKTRVITYKLVHLLMEGYLPSEIMLVTFTRAAANEMIERAKMVTGKRLEDLVAGTFHSIANRFLRRYSRIFGYDPNYTIHDRSDSINLFDHVREVVLSRYPEGFQNLVPKGNVLVEIHSYMVNTMVGLEDAIKEKAPKFFGISSLDLIKEVFDEYEKQKREHNVMDFDDLLVYFLKLLESEFGERISARFKWILVDEFQDTNKIQYEIIEKLSSVHGNVFVVGDDAQSIYSFRGARFENVEDFMNVDGTLVFKIQNNYRSTERIVDFINAMIPKKAVPKALKAVRKGGEKPKVFEAFTDDEEDEFIVNEIKKLVESGFRYSDIAVLFRVYFHSAGLEKELVREGIPYRVFGGFRFVERAHVKDVLSFLKILYNPRDVVSWMRASQLFEGIGTKTASKIALHVLRNHEGGRVSDTLKKLKIKRGHGFMDFVSLMETLEDLEKPHLMIEAIVENFYEDYLFMSYEDADQRMEDLETLMDIAKGFDSLERFISEMILLEDVSRDKNTDAVTLTTVHQAKGLEWKVVFVIRVNPGDFPYYKSLEEGKMDEEERLFYVAITRCKDLLYITKKYNPRGIYRYFKEDMDFMSKAPRDLVEYVDEINPS